VSLQYPVKYKLKNAPTAVTQRQIMRGKTKDNVIMTNELVSSHEDEKQTHHLTYQLAQFAVVWIIFFHGELGLKRRLLKV